MSATQPSLFMPESAWRPPAPETWPTWPERGRVAIDVETKDPHLNDLGPGWARNDGSCVIGVSVSIEDGPSSYLPVAHEGGDNADAEQVWRYLRNQSAKFKGTLLNHHIQYDLLWLARYGVTFPNVSMIRDTEIAEVLLDDLAIKYNLEVCCAKHGLEGKDETLLDEAARYFIPAGKQRRKVTGDPDVKANLWRLPARFVGPYAEQDTRAVLRLSRRQERYIDQDGLWEAYNLESACIPVLVAMTQRGVRIDMDRLDRFEKWAIEQRQIGVDRFNRATGARLHSSDLNKNAEVGRILSSHGVHLPATPGGKGFSVDKEVLSHFKGNPAVDGLALAKTFDTALGKFVKGTRDCVVNGRIHTSFNQSKRERGDGQIAGAITGRLSSSNPNLQNQPNRNKQLAKPWRSIFLPEEGGLWACRDYSEQEPRLIVHYAEAFQLPGASVVGDAYRTDPTTSLHTMTAKMSGRTRDEAKEIMLGRSYGMGIPKLAGKLKVTTLEAERMAGEFDRGVPFISGLSDKCKQKANRDGFVPTLMGRILRFPKSETGYGYEFTHKALNRFIQGSAAMQTKKAMVDAHNAGVALQLQVHDELNDTVESPEAAEPLAEIMRNAVRLRVPSRVTVKVGPSWGEIQAV